MISHSKLDTSFVGSGIPEHFPRSSNQLRRDIEGISNTQGDVLILRRVVDRVLTDELKGVIALIFFEYSHDALRERYAQFLLGRVVEFNFTSGLDVLLAIPSCRNNNLVILPNFDSENLWNELHLLLRGFIESNWSRQSIKMIIRKRLFRKTWSRSPIHHWHRLHHEHHWHGFVDRLRSHHINITCNQFKFSINILLATIVVYRDPPSNVSLGLVAVQCNGVVRLPAKARRSIGHFAG